MNIKKLESGYWYVRLDANRFAQWMYGTKLSLNECFNSGWWTQREVDEVNGMVDIMQQEY